MKTTMTFPLSMLLLLMLGGCSVTTEFKTYKDLHESSARNIRVMARDSSLYELSRYAVIDSALEGSGQRILHGDRSLFNGRLPLSDLVYIQAQEFSLFRTILSAGVIGMTAALGISAGEHHGLSVWRAGGSCPYVYAWNGDRFALQGEVFGTAFGKALETETRCMLPAAMEQADAVIVRLTDERPETHYVNCARLFAIVAPEGSTVVLDAENRAWSIVHPLAPLQSAAELSKKDGIWWQSDLGGTDVGGDFRDFIELTLPHPKGAATGSLVIHAINTQLINAVYEIVFGYLGDQSLAFLHQVENDPQLISTLQGWIRECALSVEVWKERGWMSGGMIPPEANDVPFSKIVRIDVTAGEEETIRVRLSSLADTWRIDAVEVDWTPTLPLETHSLHMRSAFHSTQGAVSECLREADGNYARVLPGERIDMEFDAFHSPAGRKISYALGARGYLYEWLPDAPATEHVPATFASFGPDRVAVVNRLIRHREAFLSIVYARWKEIRDKEKGMALELR